MWTTRDLYALTHIYARFTEVSGAYCCRFWLYRVCKTPFCLHSLSLYFKALEACFGNPWFTWILLLESSDLQEDIFHFHFPICLFPSPSLPARSVSTNHILQSVKVNQQPLPQGLAILSKQVEKSKPRRDFYRLLQPLVESQDGLGNQKKQTQPTRPSRTIQPHSRGGQTFKVTPLLGSP